MHESLKKHLARVFILLIGLTIAHLGVTLFFDCRSWRRPI